MPQTSSGETVYASPDECAGYIQTNPNSLGLSDTQDDDTDGVSDWREFFERLQPAAKGRIDRYCRRDFEDHPDATVTLDGGDGTKVLYLPDPVHTVYEVRVDGDVIPSDNYHAKHSGALVYTGDSPGKGAYGNEDGPHTHARTGGSSGHWPAGYGNVTLHLDYGYQTPPADVAEAEMKIVDHTIVGMAQKREGMVVQADSFEVEVNIPVAWNREIAGMLKPHRRTEAFN